MTKMKRIIFSLSMVACIILTCVFSASAAEAGPFVRSANLEPTFSEALTLTVPGLNGSVTTRSASGVGYVFKATDDTKCTFHTIENVSNAGADGRLINSNGASRSAWARDLLAGTTRTATTTGALPGYLYYAEISSDLVQLNSFTIKFTFSPDDLS